MPPFLTIDRSLLPGMSLFLLSCSLVSVYWATVCFNTNNSSLNPSNTPTSSCPALSDFHMETCLPLAALLAVRFIACILEGMNSEVSTVYIPHFQLALNNLMPLVAASLAQELKRTHSRHEGEPYSHL